MNLTSSNTILLDAFGGGPILPNHQPQTQPLDVGWSPLFNHSIGRNSNSMRRFGDFEIGTLRFPLTRSVAVKPLWYSGGLLVLLLYVLLPGRMVYDREHCGHTVE